MPLSILLAGANIFVSHTRIIVLADDVIGRCANSPSKMQHDFPLFFVLSDLHYRFDENVELPSNINILSRVGSLQQ